MHKQLGQEAFTLNHYDFAEMTAEPDQDLWKEFLALPEITEWRNNEFQLISDSELKKTIKGIHKSKSVGQSQLIGALSKVNEGSVQKTGPAFIYCHTPLNSEEAQAPDVVMLTKNLFQDMD